MPERDCRLEPEAIKERYGNPNWFKPEGDKWHKFTSDVIDAEVVRALNPFRSIDGTTILNVGSGSNDFGFEGASLINVDISEKQIAHLANRVVAHCESLPFASECARLVVCVGSVINYCDAPRLIGELTRVTQPGGLLILEFESSYSAELRRQSAYGQAAAIAETFYGEREEPIWVYSPKFVFALLEVSGLKILRTVPIHILSTWALLVLGDSNKAAVMASVDPWVRAIPVLSRWASNHLVFCAKQT